MEGASSRPENKPTLSIAKTSELSLLVKKKKIGAGTAAPTSASVCRRYRMNAGPVSTPTPTNCLRLMQWNAYGISGKIAELLNFLHSINVNISAIQKTKLTNKTRPLKTEGWAATRLDRHKNKGGGLIMLIKDAIPFVDNTAALPWSTDSHLVQQGISITMPNRQQLHIHNIYIPPRSTCSAGHNASIAHLLSNNEMSLIVLGY